MDYNLLIKQLPADVSQWIASLSEEQFATLLINSYQANKVQPNNIDEQLNEIIEDKISQYVNQHIDNALHQQDIYDYTKKSISSKLPVYIGQRGERNFATLCERLPLEYKILDTAKQGHAGDFIIEMHHRGRVYRCVIDVKKYSKTVPKKEVDKLIMDTSYGNYDAGLLLSFDSKISGVTKSIAITEQPTPTGTIPIMYLSKLSHSLITQCIEILFARIISKQINIVKTNLINNYINYVNQMLDQSGGTRRLLTDLNTHLTTQIQKCQENLITMETSIRQAGDNLHMSLMEKPQTTFSKYIKFVYQNYNQKDRPLVYQLLDNEWVSIKLNTKDIILTNEKFKVKLQPLKASTKIHLLKVITEELTDKQQKLIASFTKRKNTMILTNEICNIIVE